MEEGQSIKELVTKLAYHVHSVNVHRGLLVFGSHSQFLATIKVVAAQAAGHVVTDQVEVLALLPPIVQ